MHTDRWLATGAVTAFLAVAAGAFGAHALRARVDSAMLAVFETAVRYQMYHALALVALAGLAARRPDPRLRWVGWLFVAGIVIFSGTLYALVLTGVRAWGAVTPVGGVSLLGGWAMLAWSAIRPPSQAPGGDR